MAQQGTADLVFHFEAESKDTDLQAIREAIDAELGHADGIEGVSSRVLTTDRIIDPVTAGALLL